jgi:hypothetical protein
MTPSDGTDLASELYRCAVEKLGHERAEALRQDLELMAQELRALELYNLGFDDEP